MLAQPLGSAEVTHPFHPRRGQRFVVLKVRRVSGVETLSLRHVELGSFAVPREWTDWAPLDAQAAPTGGQPLLIPCRVEMPRWSELLRERPDLRLVVIHADLVPGEAKAVSAMLAQIGLAGAENWMFSDGFVERLRYEVDPQSR